MRTTEAEAKTKWCPFARVHVPAGLINRVSSAMMRMAHRARGNGNIADAEYIEEQVVDTKCIGSACMAWRWNGREEGDLIANNEGLIHKSQASGVCGLAARP